MHRSIPRALFILILGASGLAVLLLIASSVRIAYAQVRPGRGGGGGGGGLALFTGALPGTMQTGNANMSGTLCLGCSNSGTGVRLSASPGNGLVVQQSSITQAFDPAILTGGTGMANPVGLSVYQDAAIQLRGADGLPTTIKALSGTASVHLLGNPGASGTVPSVIIDTPAATTAGKLLSVRNNGVEKGAIAFDGAGLLVAAGYVQFTTTTPTIVNPFPATGMSITKTSTGAYNVNMAGITNQSIVVCSVTLNGSPTGTCTVTPQLGAVSFQITNGANSASDINFSFAIIKL